MVKKLWLFAAIVYTITIIVFYFANPNQVPTIGFSFEDKLQHFFAFFIMAYLWVIYCKILEKKRHILIAFVAIFILGVVLEILQQKLNHRRFFDTYDMLANAIGTVVGAYSALKYNVLNTLK